MPPRINGREAGMQDEDGNTDGMGRDQGGRDDAGEAGMRRDNGGCDVTPVRTKGAARPPASRQTPKEDTVQLVGRRSIHPRELHSVCRD